MNRSRLFQAISAKADVSNGFAGRRLGDAAIDAVQAPVNCENAVCMGDYGRFNSTQRVARSGKNPRTDVVLRSP
jgi:nucleoid DNA-binding protein